jgi:hypothetical protein
MTARQVHIKRVMRKATREVGVRQVFEEHLAIGDDCLLFVFRRGEQLSVEDSGLPPSVLDKIALAITALAEAKRSEVH